jgi:lipoate-protein ligase A
MEEERYTVDDDLIDATRRDGVMRYRVITSPLTCVVLGRGSDPRVELDVAAVKADGVRVYRRLGGGCAVVLDRGNVIVSVTSQLAGLGGNTATFAAISHWLIKAMHRIGCDSISRAGPADLVLNGRKISGACIYRSRDLLYYSATLLVQADVAKIARYLRHPPREPDYRVGRAHSDFVGTVAACGAPMHPQILARRLLKTLGTLELSLDGRKRMRPVYMPCTGVREADCRSARLGQPRA